MPVSQSHRWSGWVMMLTRSKGLGGSAMKYVRSTVALGTQPSAKARTDKMSVSPGFHWPVKTAELAVGSLPSVV